MSIELPILSAAMQLQGPRGMCFHRSVALCLDLPDSWVTVAILRAATGEERRRIPNASAVSFFHAWVEWHGAILAPTTIEQLGKLRPMQKEGYYELNGVKNAHYVSHKQIKGMVDETILNELLFGTRTPHGYLVSKLFHAANHHYKVSPQGGVIPL